MINRMQFVQILHEGQKLVTREREPFCLQNRKYKSKERC